MVKSFVLSTAQGTWSRLTIIAGVMGNAPVKARSLVLLSALSVILLALVGELSAQQPGASAKRHVIVFVWDGLRADDLTPEITPNYFALAQTGVVFADHHAVYPTFTMMNSASIATGTYPGAHGFYGNVVYAPRASGRNAKGADGHDTRALQHYLGHKNIQHTVRYTELSPDRFRDFWRD